MEMKNLLLTDFEMANLMSPDKNMKFNTLYDYYYNTIEIHLGKKYNGLISDFLNKYLIPLKQYINTEQFPKIIKDFTDEKLINFTA